MLRWSARCAVLFLLASAMAAAAIAAARPPAVWIDVPFVRQPRDGCGAASVSMVMEYWARQEHRPAASDSQVASIQRRIFSPKQHGATPEAIENYFHSHGYLAFGVNGTWSDLQQQLSRGRPLIVALRPPGESQLHYVVIAGIDPARQLVMMNDPAQRKLLTQERQGFEKDWSATHDWMLLAVPDPQRR